MKVFKPFWSFNIKNIENWLSQKALEGYMLKAIDTKTSAFIFEASEKKSVNFRILREGKGITELQNFLKNDGWYTVFKRHRWFIIANDKPSEDIKTNPSREGLLIRITILLAVVSLITVYYAVSGLFFLILLLSLLVIPYLLGNKGIVFINDFPTKVLPKNVSYFTTSDLIAGTAILALLCIGFFIAKKLTKNLRQLKKERNAALEKEKPLEDDTFAEEPQTTMKKKSLWVLEPDKLEGWLEDLEGKGFNLYRVGRKGNEFYFTEGKPRKIRYIADYLGMDKESYYELLKEDGWELVYSSQGGIFNWNLWSKGYTEQRPEIYTDKNDKTTHAKRVLILNTVIFVLTNLIWYSINSHIIFFDTNNLWKTAASIIFNLFPFGVFLYFYSKTIRFYHRIKRV